MDQLKDQRLVSNFNLQLDDIPESVDFDEYEQESVANSVRGTLYIDKIVLNLNPSFSMKKIDKGWQESNSGNGHNFAFRVVLCLCGSLPLCEYHLCHTGKIGQKIIKINENIEWMNAGGQCAGCGRTAQQQSEVQGTHCF